MCISQPLNDCFGCNTSPIGYGNLHVLHVYNFDGCNVKSNGCEWATDGHWTAATDSPYGQYGQFAWTMRTVHTDNTDSPYGQYGQSVRTIWTVHMDNTDSLYGQYGTDITDSPYGQYRQSVRTDGHFMGFSQPFYNCFCCNTPSIGYGNLHGAPWYILNKLCSF